MWVSQSCCAVEEGFRGSEKGTEERMPGFQAFRPYNNYGKAYAKGSSLGSPAQTLRLRREGPQVQHGQCLSSVPTSLGDIGRLRSSIHRADGMRPLICEIHFRQRHRTHQQMSGSPRLQASSEKTSGPLALGNSRLGASPTHTGLSNPRSCSLTPGHQ